MTDELIKNDQPTETPPDPLGVHRVVMTRFSDRLPECRWFAFIDPEDTSRWIIGWKDWYRIREEGGASYRHNDPRLTWWYPLPDVPSS
jgi:hypothetical protein